MGFTANKISYAEANAFSPLVNDYTGDNGLLLPFYAHPVSLDGVLASIQKRKAFKTNRQALTEHLYGQYKDVDVKGKLAENIASLEDENTFTVCTAHQPNIFTGHLYFVYKIIHAIKLADQLSRQFEGCRFVPVYYMGNEDADIDELGEIEVNGLKYKWATRQTGAVGKMKVDDALLAMLNELSGHLLVDAYGGDVVALLRKHYAKGRTIEQATFGLVHELFGDRGLIVLIADSPKLKTTFSNIIEEELKNGFSALAVKQIVASFPEKYRLKPTGRDINLFYLTDGIRERVEKASTGFSISGTPLKFAYDELLKELEEHPERFSPNVVLRPLYQETVLPNVAFIGGGGELAYWLQLKGVFESAKVPFPVLVLRNSFTVVSERAAHLIAKLKLQTTDLFKTEKALTDMLIHRNADSKLELHEEMAVIVDVYNNLKRHAGKVDKTLEIHVQALQVQAIKKIEKLEKKMVAAERKNQQVLVGHIAKLRSTLFPHGVLQERVENIFPFIAKYGFGFLDVLYENSGVMEQQFTILTEY